MVFCRTPTCSRSAIRRMASSDSGSPLSDFPTPLNKTDMQSFMALAHQISCATAVALMLHPFRELLKNMVAWFLDWRIKGKNDLITYSCDYPIPQGFSREPAHMNRVHVAWFSSIRSRSWDCTSVIIRLPPSSGRNKGEQVHGTHIPGGKFLFQLMHKSHHSTARFLEPRAVKVQCSLYTHIPLAVRPIVCPSVRTSLPIMLVVKVQCSLYTHPTPQCSVSLCVHSSFHPYYACSEGVQCWLYTHPTSLMSVLLMDLLYL